MTLANPIWLWGLTGLIIPVAIHLLSRKQGKTIYVGSIRHLVDSDTAQFSSLRLNEILLLILRVLLIVIAVLILAGLSVDRADVRKQKWLLIERGIEKDQQYQQLIDSLATAGYEERWLSDGFPVLKDSASAEPPDNYWQLLSGLNDLQPENAFVISYNYAGSFKGIRQPLPPNVTWLQADPAPWSTLVDAVRISEDSAIVKRVNSSSDGTSYRFETAALSTVLDSSLIRMPDTVSVIVYWEEEYSYDLINLRAALHAVDESLPDVVSYKVFSRGASSPPRGGDLVIWLSDASVPFIHSDVMGLRECSAIQPVAIAAPDTTRAKCLKAPRLKWVITGRLTEETVLHGKFTLALARILAGYLPERTAIDRRSLPNEAVFLNSAAAPARDVRAGTGKKATEPLLGVLLLLLIGLERFIARKRNQ